MKLSQQLLINLLNDVFGEEDQFIHTFYWNKTTPVFQVLAQQNLNVVPTSKEDYCPCVKENC